MNFQNTPPDKKLGQHFLISEKIIQLITHDFAQQCDGIMEVGPGPAVLTKHLASQPKPYFVIEKDVRFIQDLKEHLKDDQIIFEDALNTELLNIPLFTTFSECWFVSNLPYNISVPLIVKYMQYPSIKFMTLMMQKEVALRIMPSKKNEMSSIAALCNTFFEIKKLCDVPPGSFYPPPKVQSTVLSFVRKENSEILLSDLKSYEKFLRILFAQRRKQIKKVLSSSFLEKDILEIFEKLNINKEIRAETLSYQEVNQLFKAFNTIRQS